MPKQNAKVPVHDGGKLKLNSLGTNGEARYNKSLAFNILHVYSQGEYDPSQYAQI